MEKDKEEIEKAQKEFKEVAEELLRMVKKLKLGDEQ